ncbi:MAG: hypothetical protein M1828_001443 [Chrysothrix sp. TS-e1954]|nr:MAG: hypothetical protein M1828_001443 [Chrysothrix sp. TS-e1954]
MLNVTYPVINGSSKDSSAANITSTPSTESIEAKNDDYNPNITSRFEVLLEAMRSAGFEDFDRMAVTYYTAQFDKNSLPAISQTASRARRLKAVLQDLRACSRDWPGRESRGLYEGLMEFATSLCVEDMSRIDYKTGPELVHVGVESFLSTLRWLFFEYEHDKRDDRNDLNGNDIPEEVAVLFNRVEAAQDSTFMS